MTRGDGQAPWSPLPHTVWERWVLTAPKPLDDEAAEADYVHLTRCAIHRGHEMPPARALGTRWGWSAHKAERLARRLRQPGDPLPARSRAAVVRMSCGSGADVVRMSCGSGADVVRQSEGQNVDPIAPDYGSGAAVVRMSCGSGADVVRMSCGSGAEVVAENEPVQQLLLAPKNQEEKNQEQKNQEEQEGGASAPKARKPRRGAKAETVADDEAAAILADMHEVLLKHYPSSKPPTVSAHRDRLRVALAALAEMSAETGRPARDLLLFGWRYMVDGSRGYWQKRLTTASEWYPIACRGDAAKTNAERGMALEDARLARERAPAPAPWTPPAPAPAPRPVVGWEQLPPAEQDRWRATAAELPAIRMAGAWLGPMDLRQMIDTAAQAAYRDSVV